MLWVMSRAEHAKATLLEREMSGAETVNSLE